MVLRKFIVSEVLSKETSEKIAVEVQPIIKVELELVQQGEEEVQTLDCKGPLLTSVEAPDGSTILKQSVFFNVEDGNIEFVGYKDDIYYIFVDTILIPLLDEQAAEEQRRIALKDTI